MPVMDVGSEIIGACIHYQFMEDRNECQCPKILINCIWTILVLNRVGGDYVR